MVIDVMLAVLGFGALIFVHELGHFISAKAVGVKVEEFMFGLPGPKLFSRQWGETLYGITAIPFGGYVKFAGDELQLSPEEEKASEEEQKRFFNNQSLWKKAVVISAGVAMNVVFAILIITAILMHGIPTTPTTTIDLVIPDTPAASAGLKAEDRIVAVDGKAVSRWSQVTRIIHEHPEQELTLKIKRGQKTKVFTIKPLREKNGQGFVGIQSRLLIKKYSLFSAVYVSTKEVFKMIGFIVSSLYRLIFKPVKLISTGRGPLGIGVEMTKAAKVGFDYYLQVLASINVGLAVINFFPMPPLDGGRLLIYIVESLRRRPLRPESNLKINLAGAIMLIALILSLFIADIGRYILPLFNIKFSF